MYSRKVIMRRVFITACTGIVSNKKKRNGFHSFARRLSILDAQLNAYSFFDCKIEPTKYVFNRWWKPTAVPADSDMTKKETRWGPSVSWFMKPINYSHMGLSENWVNIPNEIAI